MFSLSFIFMLMAEHASYHSVVCLTTGPKPSPRRVLQRERSSAFSSHFQYLLVSSRSSSSFKGLLARLHVPTIFASI